MSEEPTFSLTCDEHQPDFEDLLLRSSEEEKPPNNSPKQTTLDSLLSPLETPNGTDRPELEYPDRHSPQLPACETPHSSKRTLVQRRSKKRTHSQQELPTERALPPALLNWTCAQELWDNLVFKDEASATARNVGLFERQACYLPRMRAILMDWIMEVCEAYKLRRVTYYLAVDYIDRYLTIQPDVPKTQLQLVGVCCLFMAAKVEEVYPPKLSEFAYVCDGACTDDEIVDCERLILNSLGWDMTPITPSCWLNLYMQLHVDSNEALIQGLHSNLNYEYIFPKYSGYLFMKASQIIDLFSLDPGFLKYSYSIIAAAAMYFILGRNAALHVSGLTWEQLKDCVQYMAVFYKVIRDTNDPKLESMPSIEDNTPDSPNNAALKAAIPNLLVTENHSMQTHCVNLNYFEQATLMRLEQMGLKVEKTIIKKKKKFTGQVIPHTENVIPHAKEAMPHTDEVIPHTNEETKTVPSKEDETTILFNVEKVNIETTLSSPSDQLSESESEEEEPESSRHSLNVFSLEKKTKVTFDDILASINEYKENVAVQLNSSSEDEGEPAHE